MCPAYIYILKIHRRGEAAVARVICYVFHSKTDGGQRTGRVMAAARILPPRGGGEFERRTEEENPGAENYKVTTILYLYNTLFYSSLRFLSDCVVNLVNRMRKIKKNISRDMTPLLSATIDYRK